MIIGTQKFANVVVDTFQTDCGLMKHQEVFFFLMIYSITQVILIICFSV